MIHAEFDCATSTNPEDTVKGGGDIKEIEAPDDNRLGALLTPSVYAEETENAKVCLWVPEVYGFAGSNSSWVDTGLTVNVPWLTSVSPSRLHVGSLAKLTIVGVALLPSDQVRVLHSDDKCDDSSQDTYVLSTSGNVHVVAFTPTKTGKHVLCYRAKEDTQFHAAHSRVNDVSFEAVRNFSLILYYYIYTFDRPTYFCFKCIISLLNILFLF
jgi:hypothetical protein